MTTDPPPPTKDKLAAALLEAGLFDMSLKARSGHYDDFLSDLATPCLQLLWDLEAAERRTPDAAGQDRIRALIDRHKNGDFDATPDESEAWARSADGRETFAALMGGR